VPDDDQPVLRSARIQEGQVFERGQEFVKGQDFVEPTFSPFADVLSVVQDVPVEPLIVEPPATILNGPLPSVDVGSSSSGD
jgi:hypothetical protein